MILFRKTCPLGCTCFSTSLFTYLHCLGILKFRLNWVMSESKKPRQIEVVIHYCDLSWFFFFWLRHYVSLEHFCLTQGSFGIWYIVQKTFYSFFLKTLAILYPYLVLFLPLKCIRARLNYLDNSHSFASHVHSVSYYYAVLPFYDVKCLCSRGRELGREGSHSH